MTPRGTRLGRFASPTNSLRDLYPPYAEKCGLSPSLWPVALILWYYDVFRPLREPCILSWLIHEDFAPA